jgi:hypothetical protein
MHAARDVTPLKSTAKRSGGCPMVPSQSDGVRSVWERHNGYAPGIAEDAEKFQAERDRYIRAFNRLEKAVTNHITNRCIDSDDLAHVHKVIMRDLAEKTR